MREQPNIVVDTYQRDDIDVRMAILSMVLRSRVESEKEIFRRAQRLYDWVMEGDRHAQETRGTPRAEAQTSG